ncbi:hypothetical protein DNTS_020251 [Danionella cerebrum]|uniref:Stereocilin LRR domain-containing protein n=1 Tax=Danionella cerebrum TaxID=2873325 RepID=A0A553NW76_9TELE|nr:hypothetical protein DNTS_020251 [Danionella translucida]
MAERNTLEKLDFGALSSEQQEKLRQFKIKTRIANEKYLRSHPEVEMLLSDFLRDVFLKRPSDIREFAAESGGEAQSSGVGGVQSLVLYNERRKHLAGEEGPDGGFQGGGRLLSSRPVDSRGDAEYDNSPDAGTYPMSACSSKGYQMPVINSTMNSSYTKMQTLMMENPASLFMELVSSIPPPSSPPQPKLRPNETTEEQSLAWNITEKMRNCTKMDHMIEIMRNTSVGPRCFMRAFVAPLSWITIMQNGTDINHEDLTQLLWAAKPLLETMPPSTFVLPPFSQTCHLAEMMKMFATSAVQMCPPRMLWLKTKMLSMMGPFLSQLPLDEVKTIPKEELCEFFRSPDFPPSFQNVQGMLPTLGRTIFQRLKQECSSSDNFTQNMDRLGSLVCFFDGAPALNLTLSRKMLSQIDVCNNSEIEKVKRQLVENILESDNGSSAPEMLQSLGSAVITLPLSKLSRFTPEDLNSSLNSLSQAKWSPAQATTLIKKLLETTETISSEKLLSLGSMVRGVDSSLLKNLKTANLLGKDNLKSISEKMSSLQKTALLDALVKGLPDSLLSSLSLATLEKANLSSVEQLQSRGWTRAQSTFLLKKIVGNKISLGDLRKLDQAVQGVTCEMIEKFNRTETLEMAQTLNRSCILLSRIQIRCAAQKLFASLEEQRAGYFSNIKNAELQAIPALMLIHLPVEKLQNLSDAVCPAFLEKMKEVNLSSLPNSSPARSALTKRAVACLVRTANRSSLGPLLCELDPAWISSLSAGVRNATLQAMASCQFIQPENREPLFKLITASYGDPAHWSEEDTRGLGLLVLLNDTAVERLPAKSWLKSYLSELLDSFSSQQLLPAPKEFRPWFDLSALKRKLFELKTSTAVLNRRKREVVTTLTLANIEDLKLGNVYWTPAQFSRMPVQVFLDAVPTLGEIKNFGTEQLAALRNKTLEAWGGVSMLNESHISNLGCICQSFSAEELGNLSIASLDTLEILATCNFNQTLRTAIWQAFQKVTGISAAGLGALEMVGVGQFICGLQPAQIAQLNSLNFKEAAEAVGRASCPLNITESLKDKAVSVFGKPESWSEAQVSIMGNIISGLSSVELGRLNSSVLPFIQPSAIPLIPSDRFSALSVNQLKALGPDNAAMVTGGQRAGLRVDQRAALDEAVGLKSARADVPISNSNTTPGISPPQPLKGGAAVESMAGHVLLIQAIVLVLLGYIL